MSIKTFVKQSILHTADIAGVNAFYRRKTRRRLLALCYHSVISDDAPADDNRTNIAVTVSQFDAQMQELCKHWNPVAHQSINQSQPLILPDNAVFVSFDDGWRNNLTLAAPILAKYGIPATIFLTTDYIGTQKKLFWTTEFRERAVSLPEKQIVLQGQHYELPPVESTERIILAGKLTEKFKRLPIEERNAFLEMLRNKTTLDFSLKWKQELYEFLSWDEVRQLRQMGWTIGSHTKTHQILSALSEEHLERELSESKSKIEAELGEPCETLAYPNGNKDAYNKDIIAAAKRLGFQTAFTLTNKRSEPPFDPMQIHRFCITRDLTLNSFRAIISGVKGM